MVDPRANAYCIVVLGLLAFIDLAVPAPSQTDSPACCNDAGTTISPTTKALIVLDVSELARSRSGFATLTTLVKTRLNTFLNNPTTGTRDALFTGLTNGPATGSARVFWSYRTEVAIVVIYGSKPEECPPPVRTSEVARPTQLLRDLLTLAKTVTGKVERFAEEPVKFRTASLRLAEVRANLQVSTRSVKRDGTCVVEEKECADQKCTFASISLVTGPSEHMFLSADVPLSKASDLKYDAGTRTLEPKTSPTKVYAGVNWTIGDVVAPSKLSWDRFYEGFVAKAFIEASAKPSNSFGVALAYRLPPIGSLSLDSLQLFGGYLWHREDSVTSAGQPQPDNRYHGQLRWGLGFDVGRLKDWLSSK